MKTHALLVSMLALALVGCGDDAKTMPPLSEVDRVAHATSTILIQAEEKNRTEGAARARAWELWELIRNGTPFTQVAEQNSDDQSRIDGGFMGFLPTRFDTALAGALQALRPGEMSPPVRTRIGYQILLRHGFDEAVELEQKKWVPTYGFYIPWTGDGTTKQGAYDLAERIVAQLRAGDVTIAEARVQYSKSKKIRPDAYLGATANRPARQVLWDAVSAVKVGEFAGPVETQFGWGVFQRGQHLRAMVKHILIRDSSIDLTIPRPPAVAKKLAEKIYNDVSAKPSLWSRMVKNHSDDDGTRGDDGLMGTITTGSMPKTFEDAVRATAPGAFSKPVYTEYGWHIIRRLK